MPEVQTYSFSNKELIELMIKESGVHDGDWMLQITFGFTAGNFGPGEDDIFPGGITIVQQIGITKATAESPKSLTVNAAIVNPRHSST